MAQKELAKVVTMEQLLSRGELPAFDDIIRSLDASGELTDATALRTEMGDVWTHIDSEDRDRFVGVQLLLVNWKLVEGGFGSMYAWAYCITGAGERVILKDGSQGIGEQIKGLVESGHINPVLCRKGLSRSKPYKVKVENSRGELVDVDGSPIYRFDLS